MTHVSFGAPRGAPLHLLRLILFYFFGVYFRPQVRAAGGLTIADEVQTGFGRTGTRFWGFENHGVVPDIVTMAKGIGNGVALAAVVTTPEVAAALRQRVHFNTFGTESDGVKTAVHSALACPL